MTDMRKAAGRRGAGKAQARQHEEGTQQQQPQRKGVL